MKKLLVLTFALALMMAMGAAYADTAGSAVSHVFVNVDPNISLAALDTNVDAGSIQTGAFTVPITFRVDANMEEVGFFVEASQLYKGDDPANGEVAPIALTGGVTITPTNANPIRGGSNVAGYLGTGANIGSFPTSQTNTIYFESSQSGHFSQDVDVAVSWAQPDAEKPQGEYSGFVRLTALLNVDVDSG